MCGEDHYLDGTMHMQMGACVSLWVAVQKWHSEMRVNFNVIYHKYTSKQSGSVTCLAAGVSPCVFILSGSLLQTSLTKGSICVFKRETPFCDTALQIKCDTNTITYIKKQTIAPVSKLSLLFSKMQEKQMFVPSVGRSLTK